MKMRFPREGLWTDLDWVLGHSVIWTSRRWGAISKRYRHRAAGKLRQRAGMCSSLKAQRKHFGEKPVVTTILIDRSSKMQTPSLNLQCVVTGSLSEWVQWRRPKREGERRSIGAVSMHKRCKEFYCKWKGRRRTELEVLDFFFFEME